MNFNIPFGLSTGPQTVTISDGTYSAKTTFTVGGTGPGSPGVAYTVVSTSPLANYQVGIGSINYWNGTSFPQPAWTPSDCMKAGIDPNQDIQEITISGSAPGATDQLSTVVSNPQYVPTPSITATLDTTDSSEQVGGDLVFDAVVTGPPGYPTPTGNVNWQILASTGAAPNCSSTSNSGSGNSATWTCTLTGAQLTAGQYTVTAVYTGDSNYNSASSTLTTPPVAAGSADDLGSAPSPAPNWGSPATFTATVSVPANAPAPTGQVTWNFVSGPASNCDSTTPLAASGPPVPGRMHY